jgi:hypothetical protein
MSARPASFFFLTGVLAFFFATSFHVLGQDKPTRTAAKMPEAKLVTFPSEKVMLSQALAELTRQTGIRVEDSRGLPDHPLRLASRQATFWQTVDAIAAADDARVTLFATSGRIVLDKRGPNYRLPPISYDGRFRFSVKKVTTSRDLEVRDDVPGRGATTIAIEVAWDPELQPLYLETRPHAVRFVDDKKHALTIPDDGSSVAPVDGRIATGIDLRLPPLPRTVAKISSLEGRLSMIGPSKMLTFTFDRLDKLARANRSDPERAVTQEGVTCRIRNVKLPADHWTIEVALDYPPGMKQLDSNQSWAVNNEMTLESTDGKTRFASTNYVLTSATPGHAVLSYHFRDKSGRAPPGKPSDWRVSYRAPANLIEMPIKFAFKDIPLP